MSAGATVRAWAISPRRTSSGCPRWRRHGCARTRPSTRPRGPWPPGCPAHGPRWRPAGPARTGRPPSADTGQRVAHERVRAGVVDDQIRPDGISTRSSEATSGGLGAIGADRSMIRMGAPPSRRLSSRWSTVGGRWTIVTPALFLASTRKLKNWPAPFGSTQYRQNVPSPLLWSIPIERSSRRHTVSPASRTAQPISGLTASVSLSWPTPTNPPRNSMGND
jgi:hypothetical protein